MFKFNAEWDVDKTADSLNASLFGKSKKRKAPETTVLEYTNNGGQVDSSVMPDSDDEHYSKKARKKMKKIRKKSKHDEKNEDPKGLNQSYHETDNSLTVSKKTNNVTMDISEQKLKVKTSLVKAGSPIAKVKNKKVKKNGELNESINTSSNMIREQNKKKRKRSLSESADNSMVNNKNKKAKFEENENNVLTTNDVTVSEDGKKKRKRHRKKKNNSKKNKYKHLALNSKNNTENSDISQGISSVDKNTDKNLVDKKTSHPSLESNLSTSSQSVHKSKNNSSKKPSTDIASEIQKQITKKGKHSGRSDAITLCENSNKEREKDSKHSLPHNDNSPKNILSITKKIKKNKDNLKVESSAIRIAAESDKLSPAISVKNKVKQKVLLKMLNGAHNNKPDIVGDKDHADLTPHKKGKKAKAVTSVPNDTDDSNCDLSPKAKHKSKDKKKTKKEGGKKGNNSFDIEENKSTVNESPVVNSIWGKAADLGQQAREKLSSARFRYINEQLYTSTSSETLKLFRKDQDAFSVYHEGFQKQAGKWPVNPLDIFIKQLKDKPKNLIIADFGCGDAKLAQGISQKVHSFDLVALNDRVTACDMSKTPLPKEEVDVAVFCLSLMGTNITDYIQEANRVLKTGGLLKIAEVVSRFSGLSRFTDGVCSCGFQLLNKRNINEIFYIMDFRKIKSVKKSTSLPAIKLKPCIYKKR